MKRVYLYGKIGYGIELGKIEFLAQVKNGRSYNRRWGGTRDDTVIGGFLFAIRLLFIRSPILFSLHYDQLLDVVQNLRWVGFYESFGLECRCLYFVLRGFPGRDGICEATGSRPKQRFGEVASLLMPLADIPHMRIPIFAP